MTDPKGSFLKQWLEMQERSLKVMKASAKVRLDKERGAPAPYRTALRRSAAHAHVKFDLSHEAWRTGRPEAPGRRGRLRTEDGV
jgi:hypothetical protein